jgi:hypothetical protein
MSVVTFREGDEVDAECTRNEFSEAAGCLTYPVTGACLDSRVAQMRPTNLCFNINSLVKAVREAGMRDPITFNRLTLKSRRSLGLDGVLPHDDVRTPEEQLADAATVGLTQSVATLLRAGADIHWHDDFALMVACRGGYLDTIQLLISHGADVHAQNDLALRLTSQGWSRNAAAVAALLLQHGADVHANEDAALRWASAHGNTAVVDLLLRHGADVHAHKGDAMRQATARGHADMAALLRQKGA